MVPSLFRRGQRWPDSIDAIRREMEAVFDRAVGPWWSGGEAEELTAAYPVDVREEDTTIHVDAELPGFKKDQVQVTLENGTLRIVAERKVQEAAKGKKHLNERRYTRVERFFTLPCAVDESKVSAKLADGVLHLTLNKSKDAQPVKIAVK